MGRTNNYFKSKTRGRGGTPPTPTPKHSTLGGVLSVWPYIRQRKAIGRLRCALPTRDPVPNLQWCPGWPSNIQPSRFMVIDSQRGGGRTIFLQAELVHLLRRYPPRGGEDSRSGSAAIAIVIWPYWKSAPLNTLEDTTNTVGSASPAHAGRYATTRRRTCQARHLWRDY